MSDVAYIEDTPNWSSNSYTPLKPTGLWRIESCEHYRDRLFVEHKGLFFKRWISEEDIVFKPARNIGATIGCHHE
tara:strand:+ start:60576 stop:60800 length:225 start_codon:yes stop_codon:yes gene_type:complete